MDILLHNVGVPLWAVCLVGLILAVLAVLRYAVNLCEQTRVHPLVEMGVSPRGIAALVSMAQANAVLRERNYYAARAYENIAKRIMGQKAPLMKI